MHGQQKNIKISVVNWHFYFWYFKISCERKMFYTLNGFQALRWLYQFQLITDIRINIRIFIL